jgi:hypothetical protein
MERNVRLCLVNFDHCPRVLPLILSQRMPVPEVASRLFECSAMNTAVKVPIWVRPDARVPGTGNYPDSICRHRSKQF